MSSPRRKVALPAAGRKCGLARALSKLGFCSRSQAWDLIRAGRVQVNGMMQRDGERGVDLKRDRITVDQQRIETPEKIYLMLNKPRGLVTSTSDEQGRETVYKCLAGRELPWVAPVGRLDKASEGLLLFTNDTQWAAQILEGNHVSKTYHVQVRSLVEPQVLEKMKSGVTSADGEMLGAKQARILRQGERNSWLEIVLDEGKNRQIRRMLEGLGLEVLRLIRVAIGDLELGELAKGQSRLLSAKEVKAFGKNGLRDGCGFSR